MPTRTRGVIIAGLIALSAAWVTAAGPQRGAPPPTVGTALLAGQVVDATTNAPINGVTVTLTGSMAGRAGGPQPPVVVDSQGRFFFANLPAGTFRLQAVKPGYSVVALAFADRPVDLGDAERLTTVTLRLVKLGSLAGVVRDDSGDPVVAADVFAFDRVTANGRPMLRRYSQTKTDDRGVYRFSAVRPGTYYVCACSQDPIPLDGLLLSTLAADPIHLMGAAGRALRVGSDAVTLDGTLRAIAPTFHPSSQTIARATRITLASGEEKTGVDIDAALVRVARVSGTIVGAPNPILAQSVRLTPANESVEGAPISQLSPVLLQPDGRFDFAGVPPGQYVLRIQQAVTTARGGAPSGSALQLLGARGITMASQNSGALVVDQPQLWAAQSLTVTSDGISGLVVPLRAGAPVSGRLQFVGNSPQPTPDVLGRGSVFLQPSALDLSGFAPFVTSGRVAGDGTFRIPGVAPGRYSLLMTSPPGWPTIESVTVEGVDVTDLPFDVGEKEITSMVITFSDARVAIIAGTVASEIAATHDVSVVVFPTDRRYWADLLASRRRITTAAVNAKGTFKTIALPAGEYFYALVPDEKVPESQSAAAFESLSRTAPRVLLSPGQIAAVTVR